MNIGDQIRITTGEFTGEEVEILSFFVGPVTGKICYGLEKHGFYYEDEVEAVTPSPDK